MNILRGPDRNGRPAGSSVLQCDMHADVREGIKMSGRNGSRGLVAVFVIGLAACCTVALAGCSGSGDTGDSDESVELDVPDRAAAPVVVLRPDDWEPSMPTEAEVLAHRVLSRDNETLLLDPSERRQQADELVSVLSSIREAYPAVADVTVRMPYAFGELLVGLEPQLFQMIASLLEAHAGPVILHTGYAEFDSLNESLGLSVVLGLSQISGSASFYFSEYLNVPTAAEAYGIVDGVEYAESNAYLGDGPDIEAVLSQGRWYVVTRRAEGDCPSGCIFQELFFFVVDGSAVEMIDSEQALETAEFVDLVMNRGW